MKSIRHTNEHSTSIIQQDMTYAIYNSFHDKQHQTPQCHTVVICRACVIHTEKTQHATANPSHLPEDEGPWPVDGAQTRENIFSIVTLAKSREQSAGIVSATPHLQYIHITSLLLFIGQNVRTPAFNF